MRIFLSILFLLSIFTVQGQKLFLVLNTNDCNTCSVMLSTIYKKYPKEKFSIIIPAKFIRDSVFVREQYMLEKSRSTLIFSDELFNSFSPEGKSLFVITDKEDTLYSSEIKRIDLSYVQKLLSNSATYNLYVPSKFLLFGTEFPWLINKFNNQYYGLEHADRIDTVMAGYKLEVAVFKKIFGQDYQQKLSNYNKFKLEFNSIKNRLNGLYMDEKKQTYFLATLYYPQTLAGQVDLRKWLVVALYENNDFSKIYLIDAAVDNYYSSNEYSFSIYNNKLYLGLLAAVTDSSKPFYSTAEFVLQHDSTFVFNQLLKFEIPSVNIKSGIGYNNVRLIRDQEYLMHAFSDSVFDLKKQKSISLHLPKAYFDPLIEFVKKPTGFLPFGIWDMKKISSSLIRILFTKNDQYFMATCNLESGITTEQYLLDFNSCENACLSEAGEYLIYRVPGKDMITTMRL